MVYDLPAVTGIKERVAVFFGQELADSLLWVESRIESVHLWGYVAHPSQSRSNAKGQFLFVGGRYVRDRSLGHALSEAYRGLLMVGRQPVAFLHLDLPPEEVDVNVHPTKVEVRFRDSQRIYSQLFSTLRNTFLSSDLHSRLQAPEPPPSGRVRAAAGEPAAAAAAAAATRADSAVRAGGLGSRPADGRLRGSPGDARFGGPGRGTRGPDWAGALPPLAGPAGRSRSTSSRPGVAAVPRRPGPDEPRRPAAGDAVRARGRGPGRAAQAAGPPAAEGAAQGAPAPRQLPDRRDQRRHDGHRPARAARADPLRGAAVPGREGGGRVAAAAGARAGPPDRGRGGAGPGTAGGAGSSSGSRSSRSAAIRCWSSAPRRCFRAWRPTGCSATWPNTSDRSRLPPTRDALLADLLHMVACKAAVKAGQRLTPEEIAALLERRHLVADAHHCPHGRPTALVFTKSELERQFGRI